MDTQLALHCSCSISARTTHNDTTNIVFASLIICNDSILSFPHQSHKSKFDQEHKQEQQQQQIIIIIILFFDHAKQFDSS